MGQRLFWMAKYKYSILQLYCALLWYYDDEWCAIVMMINHFPRHWIISIWRSVQWHIDMQMTNWIVQPYKKTWRQSWLQGIRTSNASLKQQPNVHPLIFLVQIIEIKSIDVCLAFSNNLEINNFLHGALWYVHSLSEDTMLIHYKQTWQQLWCRWGEGGTDAPWGVVEQRKVWLHCSAEQIRALVRGVMKWRKTTRMTYWTSVSQIKELFFSKDMNRTTHWHQDLYPSGLKISQNRF